MRCGTARHGCALAVAARSPRGRHLLRSRLPGPCPPGTPAGPAGAGHARDLDDNDGIIEMSPGRHLAGASPWPACCIAAARPAIASWARPTSRTRPRCCLQSGPKKVCGPTCATWPAGAVRPARPHPCCPGGKAGRTARRRRSRAGWLAVSAVTDQRSGGLHHRPRFPASWRPSEVSPHRRRPGTRYLAVRRDLRAARSGSGRVTR